MVLRGRAWKFGNDINTDAIVPGKYLVGNVEQIAAHVMEGERPGFTDLIKPGDIIVAGSNFGNGSSREIAPRALAAAGISAVVAKSFARIYFRNSINVGFPPVECPRAQEIEEGQEIEVDPGAGLIRVIDSGIEFPSVALPPEIGEILAMGGLEPYLARRLAGTR